MEFVNAIIEILKFVLPSLFVFLTAYYMFKQFVDREDKQHHRNLRAEYHKIALPLRLQAYERLTLLMERISLTNLIPRVREDYMTARDLQQAINLSIREEFEHNVSQQVYVSKEVWEICSFCKDETIKFVNLVAQMIPAEAESTTLAKAIYEQMMQNNRTIPTQKALNAIKDEISTLF